MASPQPPPPRGLLIWASAAQTDRKSCLWRLKKNHIKKNPWLQIWISLKYTLLSISRTELIHLFKAMLTNRSCFFVTCCSWMWQFRESNDAQVKVFTWSVGSLSNTPQSPVWPSSLHSAADHTNASVILWILTYGEGALEIKTKQNKLN